MSYFLAIALLVSLTALRADSTVSWVRDIPLPSGMIGPVLRIRT